MVSLRSSLFFCVLALSAAPALAALPAAVPSLAPMLEQATPAVVNIAARGTVTVQRPSLFNDPFFRRFFDLPNQPRERSTQSLGSGVIVDAAAGYVLTNHHVIEGAETITVTLVDGRELDAQLVGTDPRSDVAVLQVPADGLVALPMGDSGALRVGDFVVAIGNPFGLGQTVTSGIVSALGRSGLGIEDFEDFIQTDASINVGNSGGALVDLAGRLIGINTAILGPNGGNVGIGFAIPSNMAGKLMQQLIEHGEVRRGRLGVAVQDLSPALAEAFGLETHSGVVVSRVDAGSPADRAGVLPGDVVLQINDHKIRNAAAMRNAVGLLPVGDAITLGVVRDGVEYLLHATVSQIEQQTLAGRALHRHLTGAQLQQVEFRNGQTGVQVSEVEPGSPAWSTGFRPGDILLSANRREVNTLDDLRAVVSPDTARLLLNIQRGNAALFVLLQ